MSERYPVIIIGGGQAGLAMSYCLKQAGIANIILEKKRVGESWRSQRWDTFCLVTPNWQCRLPGFSYQGKDPFGFMVKDEIIAYVKDYARSFDAPVKEGVEVFKVERDGLTGSFKLFTNMGEYHAGQVVVAIGNYHFPVLPAMALAFPSDTFQIHSAEYKNPQQIPCNDVLVVGSGQSGTQIAEDLHLAGKQVHLCVGNAPRTARRYRGKDVVEWLEMMRYYDLPIDQHPDGEAVRTKTNHYVTGRDGGRDIDLRKFALEGMKLYGSLRSVEDGILTFNEDLKVNLDGADRSCENIKRRIDAFIESNNIEAPVEQPYVPVWEPQAEPLSLDLKIFNIGAVIWSIGYGCDFSWIKLPVLDRKGLPVHNRGITHVPGLYFLGLTWQHTWGSARFSGVGNDAEFLSEHIKRYSMVNGQLSVFNRQW